MSPGYESPYSSHRDLLAATTATTRQNGGSSGGQAQAAAASPASPPHSYSPLPHVYGQNGQARQNGSNLTNQNITITTSAPSPTLSAQSSSLHSPSDQQQMDKLWNGKLMEASCPTTNAGHHLNGSQSSGFVQIAQHHLQQQQPHHQQQQHHHNQNNRELMGSTSPPPSNMLQRVRFMTFQCF
jgi:hypothetical protein